MGKSETIEDLKVIDLIQSDKGFNNFLIKTKTVSDSNIDLIKSYVRDRNNLLNEEAFKALGFDADINLIYFEITDDGLKSYLRFSVDEGTRLISWSDDYFNGHLSTIGTILDFVKSQNFHNDKYSESKCVYYAEIGELNVKLKKEYTINISEQDPDNPIVEPVVIYNGEHYIKKKGTNDIGIVKEVCDDDNYCKSVYFNLFRLSKHTFGKVPIPGFYSEESNKDGSYTRNYYKLKDLKIRLNKHGENYITYQCIKKRTYDKNNKLIKEEYCSSNETIDFVLPSSVKRYLAIEYEFEDDTHFDVISIEDVFLEADKMGKCLIIPIKLNGSMYSEEGNTRAILARFGMIGLSWDEIKENDEIKHFIMSFLTKPNEKYYGWVAPFYNHHVIATGKNLTIEYQRMRLPFDISYRLYMRVNNSRWLNANALIIPIHLLKKECMKDFYDIATKSLKAFIYSSVTVHYKWYESGFFDFLSAIVSFVLSATTGNPIFVELFVATQVINEVIDDPYIKAIATIAVIIALQPDGLSGLFTDTATSINSAFQIAQTGFQAYTESYLLKEQKQLQKKAKEIEKMQKELEEIKNSSINLFEKIEPNSDVLYKMVYEVYDWAYELVYSNTNYDTMTKIPSKVIDE